MLLKSTVSLGECISTCERIYNTPIPLAYSRHTSRFLVLYVSTLPLALVHTFGWATLPVMAVVVPHVHTDGLSWYYTGEQEARQSLIIRGIIPVMSSDRGAAVDGAHGGTSHAAGGGGIENYALVRARELGLVDQGDIVVIW